MDPNFPYNDPNLAGGGYVYDSPTDVSQPQYQFHSQSQYQPPPQAQPYYQSYSQAVPQNYSQYYYNQGQPQNYQPQFQQSSQPLYQQQAQPQPQPQPPPPASLESTIEVVVPRQSSQSTAGPSRQSQHDPRINYQHQSQPSIPSASYRRDSKQQQYQQVSQPPQHNIEHRPQPQPSVVIDLSISAMAPNQPIKNKDRRTSTAMITPRKTPQQIQNRALQAVEVNTKPKTPAAKAPEYREVPTDPEPDYPLLLCVLADDYVDEARKQPVMNETYYNLISKALGCLESVLANFKLPPLREAQISLRYARILYDETENYDDAETGLTKAIELCERHKFIDLKYEMQLLLSRVLYESKPKAAIRDVQRMIEDIEAYGHTVWLYIFRFQYAMFSLASSAPGDVHTAAVQLEKISTLARKNQDVAVLAFAATLEALLHLSSSGHGTVTTSQTALAKARAMQLNPDVESNPQLTVLMEFIDLSCSVRESNVAQNETKRRIMHDILHQADSHSNWRDDGSIYVPVSKRTIAGIQLQANKHIIERNGRFYLVFSWLGREEVEVLGYLFSADSSAYKNGVDGKAEKFAKEGLSLLESRPKPRLVTGYRQSEKVSIFQQLVKAQFLLLISFMRCSKGLWQASNKSLIKANTISEELCDAFPINMRYSLLYLRGVVLQGTGNLMAALEIYQSPQFNFMPQRHSSPSNASKASNQIIGSYFADSDVTRNFSILAAMNTAFIIQAPTHPQHSHLSSLIKSLDVAVQSCGNKYIQAHFSLLMSVLCGTTLTVKQYLRSAMEAGKAIGSAQTTALALIYMQEKLFKGVVDEQALKCAKAASHQTRRWGEPMWLHVAAGLEAQALEINGFEGEAKKRTQEAEQVWDGLPEGVQKATITRRV